jgi:nitroimidazol reductase NimA-like FMN-containing flavoprotein (pyridoxamine 5'-phosphate oxidase superfamily)
MHCSAEGGQKIDNLRLHPDACFTIVSQSELLPDKFATKYWSANVFGTVAIIEEGPEKQKGIEAILRKYSPEHVEKGLNSWLIFGVWTIWFIRLFLLLKSTTSLYFY